MKNKSHYLSVVPLATAAILLLASSQSWATVFPLSFEATEDTYISKANQTTNYVSEPTLLVKSSENDEESRAVVAFNLDTAKTFTTDVFGSDANNCNLWNVGIDKVEIVATVTQPAVCEQSNCTLFAYPVEKTLTDGDGLDLSKTTWKCADNINCPPNWNGGHFESTNNPAVIIPDGYTGELRFDVTEEATQTGVGSFNPSWIILAEQDENGSNDTIVLDANTVNLEVTNTSTADTEQELYASGLVRNTTTVTITGGGTDPSASADITLSYLFKDGPDNGPKFLLLHGMPYYSAEYRNLIPLLSAHGDVYAPDLPATGYSPAPTDFTQYNYSVASETKVLEAFAQQKNIDSNLIVIISERGGLPGLNLVAENGNNPASPINIAGLVVAGSEAWVGVCSPEYEGSYARLAEGKAGEPPVILDFFTGNLLQNPGGMAYCSSETFPPFWGDTAGLPSFIFGLPLWDIFRFNLLDYGLDIHPANAYDKCLAFMGGAVYNEVAPGQFAGGVADFLVQERNNQTRLNGFLAPYGNTSNLPADNGIFLDAMCSSVANHIIHYPRECPVPNNPGVPCGPGGAFCERQATRNIYDNYKAALETGGSLEGIPRLLAIADNDNEDPRTRSARTINQPFQIDIAEQDMGFDARCVGMAGHFATEDVPLNMYQRIYEWGTDNGLF